MKFTAAQKKMMRTQPLDFAQSLKRTELTKVIAELDKRYFNDNAPVLTDEVYDIINDFYWKGKAKKAVGARNRENVKLPVPMSSLAKFSTVPASTQARFLDSEGYVVSDKEDGISLEVVYEKGVPVGAYTRGDFTTGQDVSHVIPFLKIPRRIPEKNRFIVRGEFTAERSVFQKHFAADFATSRNLGGGLLNRNVADPHIKKYSVIMYEVTGGTKAGGKLTEQLRLLTAYKFDVVPFKFYRSLTLEKLTEIHNARRADSTRDIDGIVVAKNIPYSVKSSRPTHAYAFKINSLEAAVKVVVKDVVWEESRLGKIIPRVNIEPTIIGGVKVSYFTGHNNFFIENGFTKPKPGQKGPYAPRPINKGAVILAVRSGDVIPYIMEVVKGAAKPSTPTIPYTKKGVHLYADHASKSDTRLVKELTYFFTTLDVDGLKQGVITQLVNAGYTTVKKIITIKKAQLLGIEGFAERSAKQLVDALQKARTDMTFVKVAQGSGVFGDGIGEKRLQTLIDHYPDFLDNTDLPKPQLVQMISEVKGFQKLAEPIASNLGKFIKFCVKNGINVTAAKKQEATGSKMVGQNILFTSVRDDEVKEWIVSQGGKIASTVKQATALIVKDENASNNKTAEAQQLNIPVYTLSKFRARNRI